MAMIQNALALEVMRQLIKVFQDVLLTLRRHQLQSSYAQIAKNFLREIKRMEEEVHAYLGCFPAPEHIPTKIPV
jgi:hypothetical protein